MRRETGLTGLAIAAVLAVVLSCAPASEAAMSFAPQASFLAGAQPNKVDPSGVVAADFDGDDHPDLAVAEDFSGDVSVLLAQPDGSFGPPTEFGGGLEPGLFAADGIVVGDLNGDRDPDLAVNNYPSNTVSVLLGGTGT